MNKVAFLLLVFASLLILSCGNNDNNSNKSTITKKQNITKDMLIGEWECVDITNGVMHMESIAKMQPHMVFSKDGKITSKMDLRNGKFAEQKLADFKIKNGLISSKIFEVTPYIEDGKLIIKNPSADNKSIYIKK